MLEDPICECRGDLGLRLIAWDRVECILFGLCGVGWAECLGESLGLCVLDIPVSHGS